MCVCERGHSIVLHCKVGILCSPTDSKPKILIPNTLNLPRKHKNYLVFLLYRGKCIIFSKCILTELGRNVEPHKYS